jgi:CheY-like chemotaxis protein
VRKVLVAEDVTLIGLDIMTALSRAGIEAVGPYPSAAGALAALEEARFDAALLDINLNGVPSFNVAAKLKQQGIPFAFITAYDPILLPEELRSAPFLRKPYEEEDLLSVARSLLEIIQT